MEQSYTKIYLYMQTKKILMHERNSAAVNRFLIKALKADKTHTYRNKMVKHAQCQSAVNELSKESVRND